MADKVQFRRDSSAGWETSNPILSEGEIGLDLTFHQFKIGDGVTPWVDIESWSEAMLYAKHEFIATEGQTSFAVDHGPFVDVIMNGVTLANADYDATSGTAIVLTEGAVVGDIITVKVYGSVTLANALPASGGAISGSLAVVGGLTKGGVAVATVTDLDALLPKAGGTISGDLVIEGDALTVPVGTTAERPANGVGRIRYNSTLDAYEGYTATNGWTSIVFAQPAVAGNRPANLIAWKDIVAFDLGLAHTDTYSFKSRLANGTTGNPAAYMAGFLELANDGNFCGLVHGANNFGLNIINTPGATGIFLSSDYMVATFLPSNAGSPGIRTLIAAALTAGTLTAASVDYSNSTTAEVSWAVNPIYLVWISSMQQDGNLSLTITLKIGADTVHQDTQSFPSLATFTPLDSGYVGFGITTALLRSGISSYMARATLSYVQIG